MINLVSHSITSYSNEVWTELYHNETVSTAYTILISVSNNNPSDSRFFKLKITDIGGIDKYLIVPNGQLNPDDAFENNSRYFLQQGEKLWFQANNTGLNAYTSVIENI